MEILVVLGILGVIFFGPLAIALVALAQVRGLRRRLEDSERFLEVRAQRLMDRVNRLDHGPIEAAPHQPPAPVLSPVVAPPQPAPLPSRLNPARPDTIPLSPRILREAPAVKPVATREPREQVPLENLIGERVLPRVGVIAIVLGLGLLVWYSWGKLGPEGKIALTGSTGAAMVVTGAILRRHLHTQLLGGCLIGGGWAVIYITAYASHYIAASRIISSPLLGFLVLLAVSEAALIHALRYRSETITGLAYLLTISTLLLSPEPGPAAWLAIGLSAAILVVLAWRERWIRLCAFGAALLYVAEAVWLFRTPPGSILPAMGVLVALWLLWTLPDYFHRPATDWSRRIHGLLIAINFAGVLVVAALIQRWFNLVYMGWVWLTLGALYAVHAVLGLKGAWRPAYHAALAFAAVLLFVGAREQFAGLGPVFAWTAVSAALFGWGLGRKDEIPRFLGLVGLFTTFAGFWAVDSKLENAWIPGLAIAGLFYAASAIVARLRRFGQAREHESELVAPLSHLGALALGLAILRYPPDLTEGTLLAFAGLTLLLLGPRIGARWLVPQGMCLLSSAMFFLVSETLVAEGDVWGVSRRLASTAPVLLAWLAARLAFPASEPRGAGIREYFGVLLFAGALALSAFELGAPQIPAAWAVLCGAWYLWSRIERRTSEFILAAVGAAATVWAYMSVPSFEVPAFGLEGPVASGAFIMAIFVAIHLASRRQASKRAYSLARDAFAAAIAVTGFVLLAHEMTGTWLTGSWAILGFALAAYGFLVRDRVSRWSSLLVLGVCLGKVVIFDMATFEMPVKIATLLTLGAVMVTLSFVYARHHRRIVGYLAAREA